MSLYSAVDREALLATARREVARLSAGLAQAKAWGDQMGVARLTPLLARASDRLSYLTPAQPVVVAGHPGRKSAMSRVPPNCLVHDKPKTTNGRNAKGNLRYVCRSCIAESAAWTPQSADR